MKVLILGVNGMLGHKLYQVLAPLFDVTGTIRGDYANISKYGFFRELKIVCNVNALKIPRVEEVIEQIAPGVVINCIGIIKSRKGAEDRLLDIWINSLLPHQLYQICRRKGMRLIHISTDCVFSGKKGKYCQDDLPDAEDIYGRTKYLGEVSGEWALAIRTSLIGRELSTTNGLVEWFLSNRGNEVNGFTNAIFSGFPTLHFAKIISDIIMNYPNLSGVCHVSAEPISKFELLTIIKEKMELDIGIKEYPDFYCDRSLDSTWFQRETGFKPSSWDRMIDEFTEDAIQYKQWRD